MGGPLLPWHGRLPPGDYRVAILPTQFDSKWVTWPQDVHVEVDQHKLLRLDGGVNRIATSSLGCSSGRMGFWTRGSGVGRGLDFFTRGIVRVGQRRARRARRHRAAFRASLGRGGEAVDAAPGVAASHTARNIQIYLI